MQTIKEYLSVITNYDFVDYESRVAAMNDMMEERGYKFLGDGRDRRTYLSPNKKFVVKLPLSQHGVATNRDEHKVWHRFKNKPDEEHGGIVYAPCRLTKSYILIMQTVVEIYGGSYGDEKGRNILKGSKELPVDAPAWSEKVDVEQVGRLANGKWVAYDYGEWFTWEQKQQ